MYRGVSPDCLALMNVFDLRARLIADYARYTSSFINIADPRIKGEVDRALQNGHLWPDPLLQLNPTFLPGGTIDGLVDEGALHSECKRIFRFEKSDADPVGKPLQLHTHQVEAIRKASDGRSYVLTSGTGSGKSLTYIVPIVDHVLKQGTGRGIQAIVVYPMNALANSQTEELSKFLRKGYPPGQSPVSFARYTGQEKLQEREQIRENPPDILLTNYMMLELLLTRREDRALIAAAQGLPFLVFDELHTYRGRQGADIALLIRRCRLAFGRRDMVCIGTSATMGGEGTSEERKRTVAAVAETLFGTRFEATQVVGETLERATLQLPRNEQEQHALLKQAVGSTIEPPEDYEAFKQHPLASWIESTFGVEAEEGTGRLIRRTPQRLRGPQGAAQCLADIAGCTEEHAASLLQAFLMKGAELRRSGSSRFPIFAFRLHQFLTRGDTVWATLEDEGARYLDLAKLTSKPGHPDVPMYPLAFCRQCGAAYYRVWVVTDSGGRRLLAREDRPDDRPAGAAEGYAYLSAKTPWPSNDPAAVVARLPEALTIQAADGSFKVNPDYRKNLPQAICVDANGRVQPEGEGQPVALIPGTFVFCLEPDCKVAYTRSQRSERTKLATLGVDNRSTATTILAVRALRELQTDTSLAPEARKLLSFTDNRQDASLQAGHFNDFAQVALLRSALFKAAQAAGQQGLSHGALSTSVFDAMCLSFAEYAADPNVRGPARVQTQDALKKVIEYHLYRDLQRLWRVTAPNLEDCGLLRFDYEGLAGDDGLLAEDAVWTEGFTTRVGREDVTIETPQCLRQSPEPVRQEALLTLLDVLRRNVCVKVDVLDRPKQQDLVNHTQPRLQDGTVWYLEDTSDLVQSAVAYPRSKQVGDSANGLFLSSFGGYGRYLRRTIRDFVPKGQPFGRAEIDGVIRFLLLALQRYGIVEQVRSGETPGYQINPAALRWIAGSGETRPIDRTRLLDAGEVPPQANQYFVECYRGFVDLKALLEAREHTAQVQGDLRVEREERFRHAELPLLFCSPTMELGVDIAQLNVVNMRNVPPTPANYAQRSGRAGRGGQPALVYTYCAGRSPHDQYFFREPEAMVAGEVAAPRIDLRNSDLVRSHVHAIWMQAAKPDLGKTLTEVVDIIHDESGIHLPVKAGLLRELDDPTYRVTAQARASELIDDLRPYLQGASWFHDKWTADVFAQLTRNFDSACERWRGLYRAAVRQRELHHRIILDQNRPESERNHSRRLRGQAESQIRLLTEAEGIYEGDFYSYRYFAAEGFLPGYNFPRLPLSAYVPSRGSRRGRDEFVSRPRFLALSEFGPRALVYHEGARYRVYKVNLDFGTSDIEGTHDLSTAIMKRCGACGYAHLEEGSNLKEVCERCGRALEGDSVIPDLVQMQNVSLKLAQRITCDEEERQRFGYRLKTAYAFPEIGGRQDRRDAVVSVEGTPVLFLSYGDATTLYRVNLGWKRQDGSTAPPGFLLDLERGYWATNAADPDDPGDGNGGRQKRVVPYVRDTKNALVMRFEPRPAPDVLASLQAALKNAIQQQYQLEPRELATEALPDADRRAEILFYESSEGGAGVLRQLVDDPTAIARLANRALQICHYDPETLEDEMPDRCGKACYACLLDYGNQPDHPLLDRHAIVGYLRSLLAAECRPAGGAGNREERMAALRQRCDSALERRWLDLLDQYLLRPPSGAQHLIEACSTRPDFFYRDFQTAVYIDGPPHDTAEQIRIDDRVTRSLVEAGYAVIRFHHGANWLDIFRQHADVFGPLRA